MICTSQSLTMFVMFKRAKSPLASADINEEITLRPEHLAALAGGKILAVDVREEYVVFVKLDKETVSKLKELGYGG